MILGETFPDVQPSRWRPREIDNQDRDEANDRWTQINTWEPEEDGIIFNPVGEWNVLTSRANREQLMGHWRRNRRKLFALFNFWRTPIAGLYVATGNGIATRFTLPAKVVVDPVVFIDTGAGPVEAVPQPTLLVGEGADGADDIQFVGAVANDAVITFEAPEARQRFYMIYDGVEIEPGHRGGDVWMFTAGFLSQPRSAAI